MLAVLRHVAMAKLKRIILSCAVQSYPCWCLRLRDISLFVGFRSTISPISQYINADKWDENVMITMYAQCYVLSVLCSYFYDRAKKIEGYSMTVTVFNGSEG